MIVGVISDTHGLLRPEAIAALSGVQHILHAGDVGDHEILKALAEIAPVTAIRGNIDTSGECANLPATEALELNGNLIYMVHAIEDMDINPFAAGVKVVISGHSHKPSITERNGILFLNPGAAGRKRFSLPITVAHLQLDSAMPKAEIIALNV